MTVRNRFDIWIDNDLSFGNKENNKFCAIFFKIAKGYATKEEIYFALKYAKDYRNNVGKGLTPAC